MPLTTAQRVRLRIQDQPTILEHVLYGDGLADTFALPGGVITSATAYVTSGAAWSATGATFASGYVQFSGVISAASGIRARYVRSTFSDDEIDDFVTVGGTVNGASLEAVKTLMFDGLKRSSWTAPDGTSHNDTAAMGLLRDLYAVLDAETEDEAAAANGGVMSWSEEQ